MPAGARTGPDDASLSCPDQAATLARAHELDMLPCPQQHLFGRFSSGAFLDIAQMVFVAAAIVLMMSSVHNVRLRFACTMYSTEPELSPL